MFIDLLVFYPKDVSSMPLLSKAIYFMQTVDSVTRGLLVGSGLKMVNAW